MSALKKSAFQFFSGQEQCEIQLNHCYRASCRSRNSEKRGLQWFLIFNWDFWWKILFIILQMYGHHVAAKHWTCNKLKCIEQIINSMWHNEYMTNMAYVVFDWWPFFLCLWKFGFWPFSHNKLKKYFADSVLRILNKNSWSKSFTVLISMQKNPICYQIDNLLFSI